jgi:hypothetical protein
MLRVDHQQLPDHRRNRLFRKSPSLREADNLAVHARRKIFAPQRDVTNVVTLNKVDYNLPTA